MFSEIFFNIGAIMFTMALANSGKEGLIAFLGLMLMRWCF